MTRLSSILLLLVAVLFAAGLKQLFELRFQTGDIYPSYSSLRADPLGTKALYESYGKLKPVARNYRPLSRLTQGQGTALFLLGLKPSDFSTTLQEASELELFVKSGGRLVLGLAATEGGNRASALPPATKGKKPAPGPAVPPGPTPTGAAVEPGKIYLSERWGFDFDSSKQGQTNRASLVQRDTALPRTIPFHSSTVLKDLGPEWSAIYEHATNQSVLIERRMGLGTIVIFADSYLFSNEAMLKERQPLLLAWFTGGLDKIIFEETHLGVRENTGIASLARKYGLHGVGVGIVLLAALYVWKNAVPFLPPHPSEIERGTVLLGKDSAAGFVNLLRRNVPAGQLLATCIEEWRKSCGHQTPKTKLQQIQSILDAENAKEPRQRNPVMIYEAIRKVLVKSRRPATTAAQPAANENI